MQRLFTAATLAAALFLPAVAAAQATGCPRHTEFPGLAADVVYQEFAAADGYATAWRVAFTDGGGRGLQLTNVYFKPGPEAAWLKLLDRAGLSDILIAEAGRAIDLADGGFTPVPLTRAQVGPCARLLGDDTVAREVHDAGPLWLAGGKGARNGALVLWGGLRVAGHAYLVSYSFFADGTMGFRLGDLGQGRPAQAGAATLQQALWRVDVDLGGPDGDSALVTRLALPEGATTPVVETSPVGEGKEAGVDWAGEYFTSVRIQDAELANAAGTATALDIVPLQTGLTRPSAGPAMHDFWVTAAKADETWAAALPSYVNDEGIAATDIVVWVKTAMLSEQTAEAGSCSGSDPTCPMGVFEGARPIAWTGFDIRPRNLFDRTPFHK